MASEWAERAHRGLLAGHSEGQLCRFVTITSPPGPPIHLDTFQVAFHRFSSDLLRRSLRWDSYVSVLASNPSTGQLHRHVLAIGGVHLPSAFLQERASAAGLGWTDVRTVTPTARSRHDVSVYFASNGLNYARQHVHSGARLQPFSRSR